MTGQVMWAFSFGIWMFAVGIYVLFCWADYQDRKADKLFQERRALMLKQMQQIGENNDSEL